MTVECCLFYPTPSPRLTICSIIEMLARSTVTANIFQLGPGPATRRHGPRGWEPWSPRSHTFVLGHFPNMENNNESAPQLPSSADGQGRVLESFTNDDECGGVNCEQCCPTPDPGDGS